MEQYPGGPGAQGLYNPRFEHDACGVGCVADIHGRKSNEIVRQALRVLMHLLHRGAKGSEANTGDGAGILLQVPHEFFLQRSHHLGFVLPGEGLYGVGMMCLPPDPAAAEACQAILTEAVYRTGLRILGWRRVPTSNVMLGDAARATEPSFHQVFVTAADGLLDGLDLERKLYLVRRRAERAILQSDIPGKEHFYVPSMSSRTIVYKGMLSADQLEAYFPDLSDPSMRSALAVVHQRFSTNTFPTWALAHPFRYLAHNGEINTLRGNINWMKARERRFESEVFGEDLRDLVPVIDERGSDSAILDNALEMLVMCGRSLPHAMMMLIPEAWENNPSMTAERRAFYEYHSCLMEPWDGPAAVLFTDGVLVGGVLDRNGLRPSRYYVTTDGLVVLASEVGVIDVPPEKIQTKGRLQPGRMFLVDTQEGRILEDDELKQRIASQEPYAQWIKDNLLELDNLPPGRSEPEPHHTTVLLRQQLFGYTQEDLKLILAPMVRNAEEPVGSMGTDTPLAVLSDANPPLFNYFRQLFAQVTNPPLDAIREELVTSIASMIGPERNLLKAEPESTRMILMRSPVLANEALAKVRDLPAPGFESVTLNAVFRVGIAGELERAMDALYAAADRAIADGAAVLILSDRGADAAHAPIPSLLATSGLHHHLVREGTRTRVTLIVEAGDAREIHHFCLLLGYGASAVNPYLVFETLDDLIRQGAIREYDHAHAVQQYIKAVNKGVRKVMSKMGISTLQSYRGAQIFEAIGLNSAFVDRYFTGTASRIQGIGIEDVARETIENHRRAFPNRHVDEPRLASGGQYQWRADGEYHMYNPETVHKLQHAVRANNRTLFREYAATMDEHSRRTCTLRGLMDFRFDALPVPLDEVEPAANIVRRFATGAMSFGSISKEAHETLAIAMNRIGGKSNTGEGGEDPVRYRPEENGDSKSSAIKQVASGRFGVTSEYLVNARELQIKMAQGAKPGEGGQLPGHKVDKVIARVRHSTPGVGLISPPPHHDIYSIEDLAQLIHDLKNSNSKARISVKLVSEVGVGTVAAGVAKAHADVVLISGDSGGTGAAPLTSIKHSGIPWELGLAETQQTLVLNNLRSRIIVQTDGQLKTAKDVVVAALLGAEEYGFATSALVALGCVMMRVCHLNTCPVGVATQDPKLRERFTGKPEHLVNYFFMLAEEIRELMAKLGYRTIDEMVGHSERLEAKQAVAHWKASKLDLSPILAQPAIPEGVPRRSMDRQDHGIERSLDHLLIGLAQPALTRRQPVDIRLPIRNTNRTTGTMLGSEITRRFGAEGLPDRTIRIDFRGSAGQSFGAFIPRGLSMTVEGDANDYFGKGLSGGQLAIFPPAGAAFSAEDSVIIGNVALYGATSGEAFIRGVAGERFAVRNSGAVAVVEGVGDHGCEYMTAGRVVVLGRTGRNFAAGMSGGIAYVLDESGSFADRCNRDMIFLEFFESDEEEALVRSLIERHVERTGSAVGRRVLDSWDSLRTSFVKVMPRDFRRALNEATQAEEAVVAAQHG